MDEKFGQEQKNSTALFFTEQQQLVKFLLSAWKQTDCNTIPIIAGPTGAGKSKLALTLCQELGADLISADSMQIYRGFDIGTAKPSAAEQVLVKHHLIDILSATESYSVHEFKRAAEEIIAHNRTAGKRTIVCGGTGQYITALNEGLSFLPQQTTPEKRQQIKRKLENMGWEAAYHKLCSLDPAAGEVIAARDERRILRFFEQYYTSGLTRSEIVRRSRLEPPRFNYLPVFLNWENRATLYARINQRTRKMFAAGLVEETRELMQKYPSYATAPAFKGIGYREILPCIAGEYDLETAMEKVQISTRHYAKRQMTWFRNKSIQKLFFRDI